MSESDSDQRKEYEARLQRRLQILKKQFDAGKIKLAKGMQVVESLRAVRYAPDGTVDLDSVDGLVRALALGVEAMHDREELKKSISLAEIQNTYFTFIERNFGELYRVMSERRLTPHDAGIGLSRKTSTIEELTKNLPGFLETLQEFWTRAADAAHAHVEDMHDTLKGVFGGDLFPLHSENIASKCGLYTDTLILPDPFLRSKDLFKRWTPDQQAYYLIKHGLNVLQYKELACADVSPPIVAILPDMTAIEEGEKEFIYGLGQRDALVHAGKVFGREFASLDEMIQFAGSLDTVDRVIAEVVDRKRVLFDAEWQGNLRDQIVRATTGRSAELLGTKNPGIIVASEAIGRMGMSNELLVKARRLRGTPLIEASTSWQYFVWKLEYDAENVETETNTPELHVLRGLQSLAEDRMEWLGRVPPEALIELRKSEGIHEIRRILCNGVNELSLADPTNFHGTTNRVLENIQAAFAEHQKQIKELKSRKWRFARTDIGSWLVVGSLAVAAAATGFPVWGLAAIAADQLLAAPKLRDIPKSIRELARESQELKQSPVGMLFKYSREKV